MKLKEFLWKLYPVPFSQKVFFAEHLRVMVRSGIALADALKTLAEQTTNKRFKKILSEIKTSLEAGETLSQNLARYPSIFSKTFVSMVSAGEISGTLEINLEELANQMKKEHQLRSRIKSALSYPVIIVISTVGIMILMMVYVLPRLLGIFEEFKATLPLPTLILISVVDFIQKHGILTAIIALAVILGIALFCRTKIGKKIFHKMFLVAPIIGPVSQKINLARFSRTFSSLLKTDIPVVQSLEITADTLSNVHYKKAVLEAAEEIKRGLNIAEVIHKYPALFPPLVTQMISIGEKSGTVDVLLNELANFYEEEVDDTTKSLSSVIEPLLILFLGVVIGGIAIAVIMPMYTLTQQI
jgi:type IV pilus assembly protein PilC